jgi:mRNA interferase RelE/StbE
MWNVRYEHTAAEAFLKLDKPVQRRIVAYMTEVASLENPADRGKAMTGNYSGHWRYRVGDYRLICRIFRGNLMIRVVELGHRSSVYD